jgi:hypothetical protein
MAKRRRGTTGIAVAVAALLILPGIAAIWVVRSADREMVTETPAVADEGG